MKTYFLQFEVTPTNRNKHFDVIKGALASCWVQCDDSQSAFAKAEFFIIKNDWEVKRIDVLPVEVKKEHFIERDIGLEQYLRAQEKGEAIFYTAWSRDGKTTFGPLPIQPSHNFNLSVYSKIQTRLTNKGRCFHYKSGLGCNEIINAHSIQKNRSLSVVAEKGLVYKLSTSMSSLKKNKGRPTFEKCGIKKISTFRGFCQKHDNELLAPIDNSPLIPTEHQILLYAYRSLCRELFTKENALELTKSPVVSNISQKAIKDIFTDLKAGTIFGLENLKRHKEAYDNSLRKNFYSATRYVLFISRQEPIIAFSGLLYPDFDFMGKPLQNLWDYNSKLELITFCSAPMTAGWGFLFAWHETSSQVCVDYMKSLATMIHNDYDTLGDFLFRLVMSSCENLAISPKWWEGLPLDKKEQVTSKASLSADIFSTLNPFYLMEGLEGISQWSFERVISNME